MPTAIASSIAARSALKKTNCQELFSVFSLTIFSIWCLRTPDLGFLPISDDNHNNFRWTVFFLHLAKTCLKIIDPPTKRIK